MTDPRITKDNSVFLEFMQTVKFYCVGMDSRGFYDEVKVACIRHRTSVYSGIGHKFQV